MSAKGEIQTVAIEALEGRNDDNPMSVGELIEKVQAKIVPTPSSNYVYQRIKNFATDPKSPIKSRKGKGGGYFIESEIIGAEISSLPPIPPTPENTRERHLYPLVISWLRDKGFKGVSDVSARRGGSKWSNPDVVGLGVIDDLGFFDVEICSVEVKSSDSNWQYFFFEAVSHKRFSERVYFMFRTRANLQGEGKSEVLQYAEKYGVGIVEIQLNDEQYQKLTNPISSEDQPEFLEKFVEHVPAPFEVVSMREKVGLLRRLGVKKKQELYDFGK